MQKFSGHVDERVGQYFFCAVVILIVIAINTIKVVARSVVRVDYGPIGKIVLTVIIVEFFIVPTFVAVTPYNNRGVVYIADYHFFYQLASGSGTVGFLPAGKFINNINPQGIAYPQKTFVGRIMRT